LILSQHYTINSGFTGRAYMLNHWKYTYHT